MALIPNDQLARFGFRPKGMSGARFSAVSAASRPAPAPRATPRAMPAPLRTAPAAPGVNPALLNQLAAAVHQLGRNCDILHAQNQALRKELDALKRALGAPPPVSVTRPARPAAPAAPDEAPARVVSMAQFRQDQARAQQAHQAAAVRAAEIEDAILAEGDEPDEDAEEDVL